MNKESFKKNDEVRIIRGKLSGEIGIVTDVSTVEKFGKLSTFYEVDIPTLINSPYTFIDEDLESAKRMSSTDIDKLIALFEEAVKLTENMYSTITEISGRTITVSDDKD